MLQNCVMPGLLVFLGLCAAAAVETASAQCPAILESLESCTVGIVSNSACSSETLLRNATVRALLNCSPSGSWADCQNRCLDQLGQLGLPVNRSSPTCTVREQLMAQYSGHPELIVDFKEDPRTGLKKPLILPSGLAGDSPTPFLSYLGDYQRCIMGSGMQYCLAEGSLKQGPLALIGMLGLCRPLECSEAEVADQVKPLAQTLHLSDLTVHCRTLGSAAPTIPWTAGQQVMLVVLAAVLSLLVLGSARALRKTWHPPAATTTTGGTDNPGGQQALGPGDGLRDVSAGRRLRLGALTLMEAFSLPKNLASFLRARPQDKDPLAPALGVLDGLRVLSTLWVVLGHTVIWPLLSVQYENAGLILPPHGRLTETWFQVVPGGYFAVDTFFWLSGFLGARALHSKVRQSPSLLTAKGFCLKLYPGSILARWLRLSVAYAFLLAFSQTWYREMGRGALLWDAQFPGIVGTGGCANSIDNDSCKKNWWINLLYVNNLAPESGGSGCLVHTWYLACDMQLFLLVPILVLLRERAGKATGWVVLMLLTLASVVANAVVTWNANEVTDPVLGNLQGGKFMQDIYEVSWMRAQPYLVGVGFAWLLEVLDQRRPSQGPQSEAAGPATTGPPVLPSLLRQVSRDSDGLKKDVADEEQGGGVTQQSLSAPAQVAAGDRAAGAVAAGRTPLLISQAEEEEERSSSRTWSCSESALARAWKAGSQNHSAYVAAALLLQLLSFVAMCFVVFVPVTRYRCSSLLACTSVETAPWSKMANVLYPTFCHLLWGLGLGCLMLLCFLRAPGTWWINSLLGHTAWQPPMKLSYMAYLVHPLVLVFFYCVQDQSVHYQDVWLVLNFVAISAFVFLAAFVLWICVEQPCANVTGRFLSAIGVK
eukprot:CAMPEP_0115054912 /NCGR_PEP_ID=MMETSP0227-20121206/4357_1 /TAXON_ID=89957 /ORGANISM="Polarella glacialis, Strain CCMP 1383" /LENGTH=878 /DNA_ID=CAMNT_0002439439 /DNA_START=60 /DNA_END=2696 /DNA_ORIENTATION=-